MKNHWNSTIKRKVDTGGFLNESRDCKPPVYLLLELEDKDSHQNAPAAEGQVRWQPTAVSQWVWLRLVGLITSSTPIPFFLTHSCSLVPA